jgi:hypothetical protein
MAVEIRNHGGGHSYRRVETGEKVPSVTSALRDGVPKPQLQKWAAEMVAQFAVDHMDEWKDLPPIEAYKLLCKAPYAALNRASVKGTTVHKLADRLLAGESVQVPSELEGYVQSAAAFIQEFDFQAWHTEVVVHSADEHDHAGKLDAIGTALLADLAEYAEYEVDDDGRVPAIIDWKTSGSGVFGETAFQGAGYRYSRWMVLPDGTEIVMPKVSLFIAVHLTPDGYTAYPMHTGPEVYRDFLFTKEVARISEESKYLRGEPLIPARGMTYRIEKVTE